MNFGTHPLTVEGYRERTAADLRDIPITAHGYKSELEHALDADAVYLGPGK